MFQKVFENFLSVVVTILAVNVTFSAFASTSPRATEEGMVLILEFSKDFCLESSTAGSSLQQSVEGQAEAGVTVLSKRLLDLGIEGAGRLEESQFENVLREDLAADRIDTRDCREKVFDAMFARVFGDTPETIMSEVQLERLAGEVRPLELGVIERNQTQFVVETGQTVALLSKHYIIRVEQIRTSRNYVTIRWSRLLGEDRGSGTVNVQIGGANDFNGCMLSPYAVDEEAQLTSVLMICDD